jgi:anthranilate synthase/aminodeoxychorismate synthase-like glutamine amidotransferase
MPPAAPPSPRVFMIDNYDSFTYNLVQFLGELGADITVKRNDHVTLAEIEAARPSHLVVSPGPCTPNEAGISMDAIAHFGARRLPVLGVCLGHQAIGQVYGGVVRRAGAPVHGKTDQIRHAGEGVFAGLPDPFTATRYHSLVVDEALPDGLMLTAWNDEGVVMGVSHRELPVHGVQFHPESVLTEVGLDLLATFLRMTGETGVVGGGAAQASAAVRPAAHEEAPDAQ